MSITGLLCEYGNSSILFWQCTPSGEQLYQQNCTVFSNWSPRSKMQLYCHRYVCTKALCQHSYIKQGFPRPWLTCLIKQMPTIDNLKGKEKKGNEWHWEKVRWLKWEWTDEHFHRTSAITGVVCKDHSYKEKVRLDYAACKRWGGWCSSEDDDYRIWQVSGNSGNMHKRTLILWIWLRWVAPWASWEGEHRKNPVDLLLTSPSVP